MDRSLVQSRTMRSGSASSSLTPGGLLMRCGHRWNETLSCRKRSRDEGCGRGRDSSWHTPYRRAAHAPIAAVRSMPRIFAEKTAVSVLISFDAWSATAAARVPPALHVEMGVRDKPSVPCGRARKRSFHS